MMADNAKLKIEVPAWLIRKLEDQAGRLGVPLEGLARSILESGVLGIGSGSPAPTPAPPTIHHPKPSDAPPTPAPPTIHHPKPSDAPPTPAPPTIHHPASGQIVGWREVVLDQSRTCADSGETIPAGAKAFVAMDDTGVFRIVISSGAFARRTKG